MASPTHEHEPWLERAMAALLHACKCHVRACPREGCSSMMHLFLHCVACPVKGPGGCQTCLKMWALLNLHSATCTTSTGCPVPRCAELKELRLQPRTPLREEA